MYDEDTRSKSYDAGAPKAWVIPNGRKLPHEMEESREDIDLIKQNFDQKDYDLVVNQAAPTS